MGVRIDALVSPRQENLSSSAKNLDDNPFQNIDGAYKILRPLVLSHDTNNSARYHRRTIKVHQRRIFEFKATLFVAWNFTRRPDFNLPYIARLDVICQRFLADYAKMEVPQFPPNFGAMTPRSQEAARKAQAEAVERMKKLLKFTEVTKDALVQQCIADICALALEHEELLAGTSPVAVLAPPPHQRTRSVAASFFGLFQKAPSSD